MKLHLTAWTKLCKGKDIGGIGFRNLSLFNHALLAKQAWRLIQHHNSLTARVIKGRYYPTRTFMDASESVDGSVIRRSICWGRNLIESRSRWRIGTGTSVSIYEDIWLPRPVSFKVISPQIRDDFKQVRQLKTDLGSWNVALVNEMILKDNVNLILSFLVSSCPRDDTLLWHYSMNE
ncbi:hypothetical protein Dsin_009737 [Dipteronia sinensis]|uniref:Uncharacterized protein n=1 Tax=Dipteronia sinensis TaxID=43782 RepID=A0AAE0ECD2_9ROSI|nr:hypothetical protein Dsin_009737 [Dipteronia sinensis]